MKRSAARFRTEWSEVERLLAARHAPATLAMYRSSVKLFREWCDQRRLSALPSSPKTLARFLADEAKRGRSPSTIARHVSAVRKAHSDAGLGDPTADPLIAALKQGIVRSRVSIGAKRGALSEHDFHSLLKSIPPDLRGCRDRAILLIGFAGALRRSEIAGLQVRDIRVAPTRIQIHLRRSKTDQQNRGTEVTLKGRLAQRTSKAIAEWLRIGEIAEGPLFRRLPRGDRVTTNGLTPHAIGAIVKTRSSVLRTASGTIRAHSLRSGRLTAEAKRDANPWKLMSLSRHRSIQGLQPYVRIGN